MFAGAAMAVEDAAALAEALSVVKDINDVPTALTAFEKVRRIRTSQMQKASLVNGKIWHFPDGPEQEARDAGMRAEVEGSPFDESPNQWSDPVTQAWAYGYDSVAEMRAELREAMRRAR
jgi:salicylate hydroxylase